MVMGRGLWPLPDLTIVASILMTAPQQVMCSCYYHFDSRVSSSGNFSSPGWPKQYPPGLRCTYVFQGQMFQAVKITFQSFHLEEPYVAGCVADYLDVSSVDMAGMQEFVGRYCGRRVTNPLLTLHPRLDILFRTNLALQAQGFNAHYIFLHEESVRPTLTVAAGSGTCGGLVDGPGGSLVSPGFPLAFPGDLSCTWLLRARPHYHVYLRVHQLQLQGSIANCRRAKLAIHDGYRPLERQRDSLMSFCGDLHYYRNQADREVLSQWNRLVVTFRTSQPSDNTTKFAGFHLLWTEVLLTTQANCSSRRGFWCSRSTYCVGVTMGGRCITTANFCIHPSLVCDTQPNCSAGDHSDEADCQSRPPPPQVGERWPSQCRPGRVGLWRRWWAWPSCGLHGDVAGRPSPPPAPPAPLFPPPALPTPSSPRPQFSLQLWPPVCPDLILV